eukprot:gene20634-7580_t
MFALCRGIPPGDPMWEPIHNRRHIADATQGLTEANFMFRPLVRPNPSSSNRTGIPSNPTGAPPSPPKRGQPPSLHREREVRVAEEHVSNSSANPMSSSPKRVVVESSLQQRTAEQPIPSPL